MSLYSFLSKTAFCVMLCGFYSYSRAQEAIVSDKVIKVNYSADKESKSRKLAGNFTKTAEKEWTETVNNKGAVMFFDYVETGRNSSSIYLADSANNRFFFLSLDNKIIQKKGKDGWAPVYIITEMIDGDLTAVIPVVNEPVPPVKKEVKPPVKDANSVSIDAFLMAGWEFITKKEYDNAIKQFNSAVDASPNSAEAHSGRGKAYQSKKDFDQAVQNYSKAQILDGENPNHLMDLSSVYKDKGNLDSAIFFCKKALLLNPAFTEAYTQRANLFSEKGRFTDAVVDFKKAIALDPSNPVNYISIIDPLVHLREFEEVAVYYNTYRSKFTYSAIDGESWAFFKKYLNAIVVHLAVKNYNGAFADLQEAEKLYNSKNGNVEDEQQNSFANILNLKGYVLEKMNKPDDAQQAYSQALVVNPTHTDAKEAIDRLIKNKVALEASDTSAPVISIIEPAGRSFFFENGKTKGQQQIRGKAVDPSGVKKLLLNNTLLKTEANGYFEALVDVVPGTNVFNVVATDKNNNLAINTIVIDAGEIKAAKPVIDPSLNIPELDVKPVFHAILIAEKDYRDKKFPTLPGTLADMRKMYKILTTNYTFDPKNTDTLVNATRQTILQKLISKANELTENDNLFVFYAGHGMMKKMPDGKEEGYLVPSDAGIDITSSYIRSGDLVEAIKYSNAKHILFTADACFAGTLFRDIPTDAPSIVREAYKNKSRKFLSSGNRTIVPDKSDFIEYFRLALQENKEKYITADQLIYNFKAAYQNATQMLLQYSPIANVDDNGGQFVFFRK